MPIVSFPYGKETVACSIPDSRFHGELVSRLHHFRALKSQEQLVRDAMEHPIGTPVLRELARGKKNIVIIASDHTRPVPSKIIMPYMLAQIREGNPNAHITILIATGCHRGTTKAELISKFGEDIVAAENITVHDCDQSEMANAGRLPSGGKLVINKMALDADLLVAEGFIEPHFFAGFSGGRKSVLPGIAARETVLYNHNSSFIAHEKSRAGIIEGNLIHADMIYAAKAARLAFICNVVINAQKEVIYAVAGDADLAHRKGCGFLSGKCRVDSVPSDIVITSNGGYPLDQNIYQAVKGMTAAEAAVRQDGVIIMLAESCDGHGGEEFYKTFAREKDLRHMMDTILATPPEKTRADQWQSQIFARVLMKARVIYVSAAPEDMVRGLHMVPAKSLEEALRKAEEILGNAQASILAIPDGVSVMVV